VMSEWKPVGKNEPVGDDPDEFFLWENCGDHNRRLGRDVVMQVEMAGHAVCKWPTIYDDINSGGVIWYPEGARSDCYKECDSSDAFFVRYGYTQQAFTIETPRKEELFNRTEMNTIALRTIFEKVIKR
jgi:hypothetical protein